MDSGARIEELESPKAKKAMAEGQKKGGDRRSDKASKIYELGERRRDSRGLAPHSAGLTREGGSDALGL